MAYCNDCGAALPEGARFCHICGKEVQRTPHCPTCGATLPEGSKFCSFCGTALPGFPQKQAPAQSHSAPHQSRPPEVEMPGRRMIRIPAPDRTPAQLPTEIPLPAAPPIAGVSVPPVTNPHSFTGSVQRFFGCNGSFYSFRGTGMYSFLEPISMNHSVVQAPPFKGAGKWYYHASPTAQEVEVPALDGAQIITSTPDGMYVYIAPTIYFISLDGAMRPFMDAAETLTDLVCYKSWLFVTYLGPFEELAQPQGGTLCRDRSYVIAYDRVTGDVAAILERCAGIYYMDEKIIILCDLMDSGEVRRNVYRTPVRGWGEDGLRTLANYVGRIRGSTPFSKIILDSCGSNGVWKDSAECSIDLRCCDWQKKLLGYQQGSAVIWRDFSGRVAENGPAL